MTTNKQKLYALAILAHPDDESFLLAGTSLKFREEGKMVGIICATHGEKGADRLNRELSPKQMAQIRTSELLKACDILHCECKKFFNHPDGSLDQDDFDQLVFELTEEINFYQPQIVLTFGTEGISGHRDHITIGKAALRASQLANPKPAEVWLASIPASSVKNFHEHLEKQKVHRLHFTADKLKGVPDNQLVKVNVRKYKDIKLEALKAHESQYVPHLTWEGFLEYECFEVIKLY